MFIHKLSTILMVLLTVLALIGCNGPAEVSALDDFAKCLTEKEVVLYTTYWCPHCQDQKEIFGSALQYVNVVECDPKGKNADPKLCEEKGVSSIPAWEFEKDVLKTGVQTLKQLSETTGCVLPAEATDKQVKAEETENLPK